MGHEYRHDTHAEGCLLRMLTFITLNRLRVSVGCKQELLCCCALLQAVASAVSRATSSGGGSASASSSATAIADVVTNTLAGGGSVAREWLGGWWKSSASIACASVPQVMNKVPVLQPHLYAMPHNILDAVVLLLLMVVKLVPTFCKSWCRATRRNAS
jgi:hypothetical protein